MKSKPIKYILVALLILLVLIQLIRPTKNRTAVISKSEINTVVKVPNNVMAILKTACYDCHSNNTNYYWYHEIMPLGWWLDNHVKDGKKHLNFSEFATYKLKKQDHKLEETEEEVKQHEMPLNSYTWVHKEAKLSDEHIQLISDWARYARSGLK